MGGLAGGASALPSYAVGIVSVCLGGWEEALDGDGRAEKGGGGP